MKQIPQVLRTPAVEVIVNIFRIVDVTYRVAWDKEMNKAAFFKHRAQGLQFFQGIERVLKGVIGNDGIH